MQKRGLSTIVASVLLILLVIVAIGIIWTILKPSLTKSAEEIDSSLLTVNMKIDKVTVVGDTAAVKISRQAGQGQVDKIRVVIFNETSSEVTSFSGLNELESRTYSIPTKISNISKISIAPILVKEDEEKVGLKSDEYILRKTAYVETPETPSTPSCPTGLVSYWKFNENLDDLSSGNSGTIVNSVSYTDGKFGKALQFNGGYANFVDTPSLRLPSELSIEFWAKRTRTNDVDIILEKGGDWNYGSPNYGAGLHSANSNYMFYFFYDGGYKGTSGVTDLNWHYYTVTAKNGDSNIKLYIDGVEKTIQYSGGGSTVALYNSNLPLHVGAQISQNANYFSRNIADNIAIYNRLLTSQEVLDHYNSGNGKELC